MRTHGIGQARATRIHRTATDRHHAARPGTDKQDDDQHENHDTQQEPNENTTEKAQPENENTEEIKPTEIKSRNDRD
ncbi:hypothetical protein [Kineosporia sp. R_H_3]|uniref:hypothetical protein n=1 Tax=Kineosporia sp. R_H_3 TaxID=1961848 RepID=UPI000B4B2380|nr:hypothetical protein [Kineosporia sp. R_H_3]